MQEMHAYALGLADETGALLDKVRKEGQKAREGGREPTVLRLLPRRPPSNTGVTTTKTRTRKGERCQKRTLIGSDSGPRTPPT